MSTKMEDKIKRWTAKRKSALMLDISMATPSLGFSIAGVLYF